MISFEYAAAQLAAVWRLAWNNDNEREPLDCTVDGVFRSLFAIVLAAPFMLFSLIALKNITANTPEGPSTPLLESPLYFMLPVELAVFVVDWGVSIIALVLIARAIDAERRITATIVAYNWAQVITAAAQTIPFIFMMVTKSAAAGGLALLPVLAFSIAFYWGVLRRSLEANIGVIIATIATLFLAGAFVRSVIHQIASLFLQTPIPPVQ